MRVLSLWQPWASLIAFGVKTIETRDWSTTYRGPIAIHASKRWTRDQLEDWDDFVDRFPGRLPALSGPVGFLSRVVARGRPPLGRPESLHAAHRHRDVKPQTSLEPPPEAARRGVTRHGLRVREVGLAFATHDPAAIARASRGFGVVVAIATLSDCFTFGPRRARAVADPSRWRVESDPSRKLQARLGGPDGLAEEATTVEP